MALRRPGRPSLAAGEPSVVASARIPPDLHDQICRLALARGISVGSVVRFALIRLLREQGDAGFVFNNRHLPG